MVIHAEQFPFQFVMPFAADDGTERGRNDDQIKIENLKSLNNSLPSQPAAQHELLGMIYAVLSVVRKARELLGR